MAGKIRQLADRIIATKAKGNEVVISLTKAKFAMKGINVDQYNAFSGDDPVVLQKLQSLAKEMGLAA